MTREMFAQAMDALNAKLDKISDDNHTLNVELTKISEQNVSQSRSINEVKLSVDKLTQAVFTGNGQPSLLSRVSAVEAKDVERSKTIDEVKEVADEIHIESQRTSKKYNLILAGMIGGFILFICDAARGTEFIKFVVDIIKG